MGVKSCYCIIKAREMQHWVLGYYWEPQKMWQSCYCLCGKGNVTCLSVKGWQKAGTVFRHKWVFFWEGKKCHFDVCISAKARIYLVFATLVVSKFPPRETKIFPLQKTIPKVRWRNTTNQSGEEFCILMVPYLIIFSLLKTQLLLNLERENMPPHWCM